MPRKYQKTRDEYIGARATTEDKITLQENGYTGADAIALLAEDLRTSNPRKKISIKKKVIDIQLERLKKAECEIQSEIEVLETKRANLNDTKSDSAIKLIERDRDDEEIMLPPHIREAVTRIQYAFNNKRDLFVSSKKSDREIIEDFMIAHDDFISNAFNEFGKGLDWRDFKEVMFSEIVV